MVCTFLSLPYTYPGQDVEFPHGLTSYALTESLLEEVWTQVQISETTTLKWSLKGIPNVDFYQDLHCFLRKWCKSRQATKFGVGRFYIAIDMNLQVKGCRPDSAYRFVQRVSEAGLPRNTRMNYGLEERRIRSLQSKVEVCTQHVQKLTVDYTKMKKELEKTKRTLEDITNSKHVVERQRDQAQKQASKLKKIFVSKISDYNELETVVEELESKNLMLSGVLVDIEKELSVLSSATSITVDTSNASFCFTTKSGKRIYSPAIRKLYYNLLANQISPSKICDTVKCVLKCFLPALDVEHLQLPKERCAGYMRKEELATICMAHKASAISKQAEAGKLHLNTDGTTLQQKKLGGLAINGMVISVNELSDGSADSAIEDVSRELSKLREMARALCLPNADAINWSLVSSSTSDSAATQKRFNKLMEELKKADIEKFGQTSPDDALDILENFCAMHLGVNLRKAFLSATHALEEESGNAREYHPGDVLVHECCKLIGKCGTPEYGCGVLNFPDFIDIMIADSSMIEDVSAYYSSCTQISLERQVGSRYFVTASNASKLFFLKDAAINFLEFTGKSNGNRLEKDVYDKLKRDEMLTHLKVDGLMFYHVYADLMVLAKSNALKKSALDMTYHYLELLTFLRELQQHPDTILEGTYQVFRSEKRLYGDDKNTNHRVHKNSKPVHERLLQSDEWDKSLLYPLVVSGAAAMEKKLCEYARDYLPGGLYWNPDPKIKEILSTLKPTNDLCESLLGLNDYLSRAIPNMHQMTRSNMIQVKKNKTIDWLQTLPETELENVVDLAVRRKAEVLKESQELDERNRDQRREKIKKAHMRRQAFQLRSQKEREKLLQLHLITSRDELLKAVSDIDHMTSSYPKKKRDKLSLLRSQLNIWKKILKRNINIPFTYSRAQRPLDVIVQELGDYIEESDLPPFVSSIVSNPTSIIGKNVKQKFEHEDTHIIEWYCGSIVDYDALSKIFEIKYEGEEELCKFDIVVDLILGDLVIVDL